MRNITKGILSIDGKLDTGKTAFTYIYPYWGIEPEPRLALKQAEVSLSMVFDDPKELTKAKRSLEVFDYTARINRHIATYPGAIILIDSQTSIGDTICHILALGRNKDTYFIQTEGFEPDQPYDMTLSELMGFIGKFPPQEKHVGGMCLIDDPFYPGCVGYFAGLLKKAGYKELIHHEKTLSYRTRSPRKLEHIALNMI